MERREIKYRLLKDTLHPDSKTPLMAGLVVTPNSIDGYSSGSFTFTKENIHNNPEWWERVYDPYVVHKIGLVTGALNIYSVHLNDSIPEENFKTLGKLIEAYLNGEVINYTTQIKY